MDKIEEIVANEIFILTKLNIKFIYQHKDDFLTSTRIGLSPLDMVALLSRLENLFLIKFEKSDLSNYGVSSFNKLVEVVQRKLDSR